jgi:hypothetical protein
MYPNFEAITTALRIAMDALDALTSLEDFDGSISYLSFWVSSLPDNQPSSPCSWHMELGAWVAKE